MRKFSPLTSSGNSQPLRFTNTAIESYGIILRKRIDNKDSVSLKLSETPRSWLSSNMACASCLAAAIEVRKSTLSEEALVGSAHFSNPAAGASPRSTCTVFERVCGTTISSCICATRSSSTYRRCRISTTCGSNHEPERSFTRSMAVASGTAGRY